MRRHPYGRMQQHDHRSASSCLPSFVLKRKKSYMNTYNTKARLHIRESYYILNSENKFGLKIKRVQIKDYEEEKKVFKD